MCVCIYIYIYSSLTPAYCHSGTININSTFTKTMAHELFTNHSFSQIPRAEEIWLEIITTAKSWNKFSLSPRNFRTKFHGIPQKFKQVCTRVNGSSRHSKEWTGKLSSPEIQIFWVWSPPWGIDDMTQTHVIWLNIHMPLMNMAHELFTPIIRSLSYIDVWLSWYTCDITIYTYPLKNHGPRTIALRRPDRFARRWLRAHEPLCMWHICESHCNTMQSMHGRTLQHTAHEHSCVWCVCESPCNIMQRTHSNTLQHTAHKPFRTHTQNGSEELPLVILHKRVTSCYT